MLAMDFFSSIQNHVFLQLIIAAGLGALIGLERELAGKDPGLRTFSLISLGSCLFSIISIYSAYGVPNADPGRIGAQIVSGIGFLGAGAIFRSPRGISGLTTAALMWMTAAVGMTVGLNRVSLAVQATLVALFMMLFLRYVHRVIAFLRPETKQKISPQA